MESSQLTTIGVPALIISYCGSRRLREQLKALEMHSFTRVYVSLDGPREGSAPDGTFVDEVKQALDAICPDVTIRQLRENLGSRQHCVDAISWLFEQEEVGLILEDDVHLARGVRIAPDVAKLFTPQTFGICLYGGAMNDGAIAAPFFSTWGWVGERQAWQGRMGYFAHGKTNLADIKTASGNFLIDMFWRRWIKVNHAKSIMHWDVATQEYLFASRLTCVFPPTMVRNAGFASDATNTTKAPLNYIHISPELEFVLNGDLSTGPASQGEVNTLSWTLHSFPFNLPTFFKACLRKLGH